MVSYDMEDDIVKGILLSSAGVYKKNWPLLIIENISLLICRIFVDTDMKFSWTEEEVADMYDNTGFIIAADGRLLNWSK